MSPVVVLVLVAGGVAALLVWNTVSRVKHVTEVMLQKYAQMLEEVRAARVRQLEAEEQAAQQVHSVAGSPPGGKS